MKPAALRATLAALAIAGLMAACGGDTEATTTTSPMDLQATMPTVTAPILAQGTGELVVSDGNTYPLAIDGACDIADHGTVSFTATSGDVAVSIDTDGGFGRIEMSGGFEAAGPIDELAAADGVVLARGSVTPPGDEAFPLDVELAAHCG